MSATVAYALASLACAGLSDVVFKRFSSADRSRGLYVAGIGVTWTLLQGAVAWASAGVPHWTADLLAYGLAAGILVALSNTLLIESLTHIDVGLGSTVYRLNTIAVVIMAVLLLGESWTATKAAGVLLGIAAVVLLFERRPGPPGAHDRFVLFFGLVVLASLLRACFGVLSRHAITHGVGPQELLLVNAPVWIVVGLAYGIVRRERLRLGRAALAYSAVSGLLIFGVANFLLLALQHGEASVAVPIANMSFAAAMLLSLALGMERLTARKGAALALAVLAILVLAGAVRPPGD